MSLIKCGTDENGSYIELKRPRGETPLCFIDECGVVHDTIRIYEYKAVRSKEIPTDSRCVMCGAIIPEGSRCVRDAERRWRDLSKFRREEDEADKWLREHDPYYTSSDRDKRKKMNNPYETPEQEKRRRETEIPLSNLNSYQRVQFKQVGGSYTERGEFDL